MEHQQNKKPSIFDLWIPCLKIRTIVLGFLGYQFRGQGNSYYFYPFDQRTRYGSIQWGRRLKWPDDYFRAFWEITVRQTEYMGEEDVLEDYIGSFRKSTGINLSQSIIRDSRDLSLIHI